MKPGDLVKFCFPHDENFYFGTIVEVKMKWGSYEIKILSNNGRILDLHKSLHCVEVISETG